MVIIKRQCVQTQNQTMPKDASNCVRPGVGRGLQMFCRLEESMLCA
jgi:hypothetical protein